jgi:hypothetical protein
MRKGKRKQSSAIKFDEQRYGAFLIAMERIASLLKSKISNSIDIEEIFVSKADIKDHISGDFKSKPEEFTKENIVLELLDFLGYIKQYRASESELKKAFGIRRYPDYKLIVDQDLDILVEAEPLNSDLRTTNHGINQVIDWIQSKGATDYGIATDGVRWILIEYSLKYRKHNEVIELDLSPFFISALKLGDGGISGEDKAKLFMNFYNFFSRDMIASTLAKKTVELEDYQEDISSKFYKDYMRLVFGERINATSLFNSIINVQDTNAKKRIAQTVINRLIFIKFIEARGWLNNDKDFLSNLIKTYKNTPTGSLYDSYFKVLFFNVLNNPDDSSKKGAFSGIKYLNGGLFGKTKEEEASPDYSIKDDILLKVIEFLESYRFETNQVSKLEKNLIGEANLMSPEILGYIFERTANHEHGAYYTPDNVTAFITSGTVGQYITDLINLKLTNNGIYLISKPESFAEIDELSREEISDLYDAIKKLRVLDPACGSGAFFMPVIGQLMQVHRIFTDKLGIPFEPYKIKKQIIENNIFGAELNHDAAEIAKLRLWLELVSTTESIDDIDLLPNIEYNIISGNSLLGMDASQNTIDLHSYEQLNIDDFIDIIGTNYHSAAERIRELSAKPITDNVLAIKDILIKVYKEEHDPRVARLLKKTIDKINARLKLHLDKSYAGYFTQNGIANVSIDDVSAQRPIHWILEFHDVIMKGGFDIVLGNPPYIELSKIDYPVKQYSTEKCGNTYAPFFERAIRLTKQGGYFGYIVPISSICTDRMAPLQELLIKSVSELKISNYDDRPDKIFKGLEHCRSSIIFGRKSDDKSHEVYSTHYHRWYAIDRDSIFKKMQYINVTKLIKPGIIPKLGNKIEKSIIEKLSKDAPLATLLSSSTDNPIIYHNAPQYWIRALDFMPEFNNSKGAKISPHNKIFYISEKMHLKFVIAALNSSLFYWFFIVNSNCRDLTDREIQTFTFDPSALKAAEKKQLETLTDKLMEDYKAKSKLKDTQYETTGNVVYREFYPKLSKPIIDKIDDVVFDHYNFTEQEKEYIRNFDIKFRMGM